MRGWVRDYEGGVREGDMRGGGKIMRVGEGRL
jgi:hypothetical protein